MKVTVFSKNKEKSDTSISSIDVYGFLDRIRHESRAEYIRKFRDTSADFWGHPEWYVYLNRIPRICASTLYTRRADGTVKFHSYNGIVVLEVDGLMSHAEVEKVKREAMLTPQTIAAFCGSCGLSVKILVQVSLPNQQLPQREEDAMLFHAKAYQTAVFCYAPALSHPISITPPSLDGTFRMTLDAEPLVNPHPVPLIIEQPRTMPKDELGRLNAAEHAKLLGLSSDPNVHYTVTQLFEAAYRRGRRDFPDWTYVQDPLGLIDRIARYCTQSRVPEEDAVYRLCSRFFEFDPDEIREIVHSMYLSARKVRDTTHMTKKQEAAYRLREFVQRRYNVRFNELRGAVEVRSNTSISFVYHELDKARFNTIMHEASLEGVDAFASELKGFLESDMIDRFNPVEDYLNSTGEWDGHDHIRDVARMVPTDNPNWPDLFFRWFLSVVAHWQQLDTEHSNNTAPILIGRQGYRKSTFCRILLPPELRMYFTDSLDFRNEVEAERLLGRCLLINIDEFDRLTERQYADVKHLFQKPVVSLRRSYSSVVETQRRYASFIGTSNQEEVLRDSTGNRRFLCIEVTAPIRVDTPIDYRQLYAQAVHAINHGERYWIDDREEAVIREGNELYVQQSPLEVMLRKCYRVPHGQEGGEWFTIPAIIDCLAAQPNFDLKECTPKRLGRTLRTMGAEKKKMDGTSQYRLQLKL